ncbi:MAG: hypothetical protein IPI20_07385 [Rhodoferax sp.]|nr:hypothetical protein [Rhodoferax sp.]
MPKAHITTYVQQMEDAIFGAQFMDPATGYAYLDGLGLQVFKNVDGNCPSTPVQSGTASSPFGPGLGL